jgi:hypothetical protein
VIHLRNRRGIVDHGQCESALWKSAGSSAFANLNRDLNRMSSHSAEREYLTLVQELVGHAAMEQFGGLARFRLLGWGEATHVRAEILPASIFTFNIAYN